MQYPAPPDDVRLPYETLGVKVSVSLLRGYKRGSPIQNARSQVGRTSRVAIVEGEMEYAQVSDLQTLAPRDLFGRRRFGVEPHSDGTARSLSCGASITVAICNPSDFHRHQLPTIALKEE